MLMLSPVKIQYTQINTNIYGIFLLTLFLWAHTDGKGYRGVLLIRLYREIKKPHLSALGEGEDKMVICLLDCNSTDCVRHRGILVSFLHLEVYIHDMQNGNSQTQILNIRDRANRFCMALCEVSLRTARIPSLHTPTCLSWICILRDLM